MIINIRGTHGSGKSTLVRRIKELYADVTPTMLAGRQRPIGYICRPGLDSPMRQLFIPGSYETPTGGCDTISSIEQIFDLVKLYRENQCAVLFEGIVAQHSAGRLLDLHMIHPVKVIALSTTQDECVASVMQRRADRGQTDEFDPKNVIKEFKSVLSSSKRLKNDGLPVEFMTREDAFQFVKNALERVDAANSVAAG